jgi:hypothetical protein
MSRILATVPSLTDDDAPPKAAAPPAAAAPKAGAAKKSAPAKKAAKKARRR